jgi:DNA modification methylase
LSKSKKYYYDHEAIKEPSIYGIPNAPDKIKSPHGQGFTRRAKGDKQRGHGRRHDGFNDRWDQMSREEQCSLGRNKRDVWTVSTKPYAEAHFAVFPQDLIRPCVLAGCPEGGIVLDPFFGAGTTGLVAKQEGRGYIGIELNAEYVEMARARIRRECPMERLI